MNIYQRIILILGAGALVFVLWTAPKYIISNGVKYDYSHILEKVNELPAENVEKAKDGLSFFSPSIDIQKTVLRVAVVIGVTVLLYLAFGKTNKKERNSSEIKIHKDIFRIGRWRTYHKLFLILGIGSLILSYLFGGRIGIVDVILLIAFASFVLYLLCLVYENIDDRLDEDKFFHWLLHYVLSYLVFILFSSVMLVYAALFKLGVFAG